MKGIFVYASTGAYKFGLVMGAFHLVISWWIIISLWTSDFDAQWQLTWIFLLPFDLPFSLLDIFAGDVFRGWSTKGLPGPLSDFHSFVVPMVVHGIIGPLQYFLLPVLIDGFMTRRSIRARKAQ